MNAYRFIPAIANEEHSVCKSDIRAVGVIGPIELDGNSILDRCSCKDGLKKAATRGRERPLQERVAAKQFPHTRQKSSRDK